MKTNLEERYTAEVNGTTMSYYMAETDIEVEGRIHRRYGVAIDSSDGSSVRFPDIYGDPERAAALVRALWRGVVTPVTAKDVVEDVLCGLEVN